MNMLIMKEIPIRVPKEKLTQLVKQTYKTERKKPVAERVQLIFVSDKTMKRLNTTYRGKAKTTDVLSFPLNDSVFGEVYISVPVAMRQAKEYGVTVSNEIIRLFCHGLLHLYGYDHHKADETKLMRKREHQ
jgi:probable rRNA maturation factor